MRKARSMILEDWRNHSIARKQQEFKILQIKNSTEFVAGDTISKSQVNQRIQAGWDITIRPKK